MILHWPLKVEYFVEEMLVWWNGGGGGGMTQRERSLVSREVQAPNSFESYVGQCSPFINWFIRRANWVIWFQKGGDGIERIRSSSVCYVSELFHDIFRGASNECPMPPSLLSSMTIGRPSINPSICGIYGICGVIGLKRGVKRNRSENSTLRLIRTPKT